MHKHDHAKREQTPEEKTANRILNLKALRNPTPEEQAELAQLEAHPQGQERFDEILKRAAQPKR